MRREALTDRATVPKDADHVSPVVAVRHGLHEAWSWLRRRLSFGLSTKLLLLTILFVMLAEVLIFVPSIANFRVNWLNDRLMAARLAALATQGRDGEVSDSMRMALLSLAQVKSVAVKRESQRRMVLAPDGPIEIDDVYDFAAMAEPGLFNKLGARIVLIRDALAVYLARPGRTIRVMGRPQLVMGNDPKEIDYVEIVLPEQALRQAMIAYGLNILALSIVISVTAACMLYAVLTRLLVAPILRIASTMVAFSQNPADPSRIITPTARSDEIGVAERELERMQRDLAGTLHSQKRLAALGLAVAKIAHDLRNMLSSAQLISDRLAMLKDPAVQRFAPKLMTSLDRAIAFCNDTVRFGRADEAVPQRTRFLLLPLCEEVGDGLILPRAGIAWQLDMSPDLEVDADMQQMFRLLNNLVRNAVGVLEANPPRPVGAVPGGVPGGLPGSNAIAVEAERQGDRVRIVVRDTGPGLSARAKSNLFKAFQGGATAGGSGLGLAIAAEIVAAHAGTIRLLDTARGAAFEIVIPDSPAR